ncbi:uncharacterized protein LOC116001408 [Ipomoea triloba]|uniref:uncharacterized protein LOC116001408 n=1 Tax=Ipomoea triloba TaxID=35885 RepID=UPI00125D4E5E|nr:uncharacterized protein LOC116001408 [Ipomoea triloba]
MVMTGEFTGRLGIVYVCLRSLGGLGFKDLRAFNLAMLGKQAWRFLTMLDSLVARIYKARYFPKSSFVDAKLGSCPSYCWRSIMAAHDMVCGGVRRRIGDGKTTLIWGHLWLPDDPTPMINTAMPAALSGSLVSGLMVEGSPTWDQAILSDIFLPDDINRISRIPISPSHEDSWLWYDDPRGLYSVKSGYRHIMGELGDNPMVFDKWNLLWKIKVPPKWKTFLWRALNNILPVTTNLLIRRVEVDPTCPKCGLEHEDLMHALVLCDYSQLIWHESELPIYSITGHTFDVWFANILHTLTEDHVDFVVAVLYHLWQARNAALWENTLPMPRKLLTQAGVTLNCPLSRPYHSDSMKASYGAVLLSPNGEFAAACAGRLPDCFSPLMAEAHACKEVLLWLTNKEVTDVQLHTDCAQLQAGLTSLRSSFRSYVGFTIENCKSSISTFNHCHVCLIPRTANISANTLATLAFSQDETLFWDSVLPVSISAFLH